MRQFKCWDRDMQINGNHADSYYRNLPDHDLGAFSNFFNRLSQKRNLRTCLDIGANIGLASLTMHRLAPEAQILAFEPSPLTFKYLSENISQAGCSDRVSMNQLAMGEAEGSMKLFVNEESAANNHISIDGAGIAVAVSTIDIFCRENDIDSVDFIKIDTEGFDNFVLKGASQIIFRDRPVIMFEFNEHDIISYFGADPVTWMRDAMICVGAVGVVDAFSGLPSLLPSDPEAAVLHLRSLSKTDRDVFDLATQIA
jgi:FkbM family methyltransferase